MKSNILIVRKMSALEYYYNGNHPSKELLESDKKQKENIKKILKRIKDKNYIYDVVTRKELTQSIADRYDFIFSLGGDGTVIATAAYNKNKPQLNLKTDEKSIGALCAPNTNQALENFFNQEYNIEEWTRQDIYINYNLIGRALNETCIGEMMKFTKMARYNMNNKPHKNSGLIIVTGIGSTGWPNAFEPYEKNSKEFKFRTILPCQGPKTGGGNYFKIEYKGHEGKVALDTMEYDLPRDSILEIKVSKNPLKIITPKNGN